MSPLGALVSILIGLSQVAVSLTQWQGPLFSQQPPGRLVFSNASGSQVSCSALGTPSPRVTWLLQDGSTVTAVPGLRQTLGNGTLYFPPFRAQDYRPEVHNTIYRCRADNSAGAILSREVHVKAVVSQHYDVQVFKTQTLTGNSAVLTCVIPPHVKDYVTVTSWFKDDHILLPGRSDVGGRYVVTSGTGELLIRGARAEDALSRYSCLTLHSLTGERKRSQPAMLTVTEPSGSMPTRLVQRTVTEVSAERGADVHLSCAAQGNPPPTFTWYRTTGGVLETVPPSLRVSPGHGLLHIRRVEASDAGRWLCEAQNQFGSQRLETVLTVTAVLSAHVQPQVQIINSGGTAYFNCSISGSPISSVTWLHNTIPLPLDSVNSASSARVRLINANSLQVTQVTRADRGMYQCVVKNDRDSATASAELRLGDTIPELQYTFIEQALRPGPQVSLRCSATGSPPPQFSWLLDGQPLAEITSGHRYAIGQFVDSTGDVISHLNISSVRPEDGGLYSCNAGNTLGTASHAARVNIYGPPYIRAIGPVKAVSNGNITLHCPYSGYPIASVKWERRGQELPLDLRHKLQDASQGGSLQIANVDPNLDAGSYTCIVSSRSGEIVRRELQLLVLSPPVIENFAFPSSLQEGGRAQVTCSVTAGDMPVYFSWRKDGVPISSSLQVEERNADFFSMLIFKDISSRHSGTYTCFATNSAAKVNFTAELMVKVPPQWIYEPQDASALLGSLILIHCAARGFPNPEISWLRGQGKTTLDYEPINSLEENISILENGSLKIESCSSNDEGHYLCRANNGIGSGLTKVIHVAVNEPARFEIPSKNVSTRRGDPINLSCDVIGDNPIQIMWTHNGNRVEMSSYRVSVSEIKTTTGVSSQLSLSRADRQDSGTYKCQAENTFGRSDFVVHLAVQERPDPPGSLEVVEVGGRSIRLAWRRPFDGNSPVLSFLIQYQPLGAMGIGANDWSNSGVQNLTLPSLNTKSSDSSPREFAVVSQLRAATAYALRMLAVNEIASSSYTEPVVAKTQEEAPAEAPPGLQVTTGGPGELLVTWQVPSREYWNGDLLGYTVQHSELSPSNHSRTVTVHGWASTKVLLTGLKKFTRYEITVRAFNTVAFGPSSVPVLAATLEGVPEAAPQGVTCSALSSQNVQVTWSQPPAGLIGGILQGYKVMYRPVPGDQLSENSDLPTPVGEVKRIIQSETYLHALQRFTNYSIQVLAFTTAGDGIPSSPIYCHTEEDVPGPPSSIKAVALTGDSILISWLPPTSPNGLISQYSVYSRAAGRVGTHATQLVRVDPASNPSEFTAEVRGLAEHQLYEFWVSASTSIGEGEPTSIIAQATNTRAPAKIASFSRIIRRPVGAKTLLTCIAIGNPTPRARWLHRGRPITFSTFYAVTAEGHLQIHSVDQALAGNYTCSAKNLFGEDEITYTVEALLPPGQPLLELQYTTTNSIKVRWQAPVDGGASILGYILSVSRESGAWWHREIPPDLMTYTIEELKCGSSYNLYILAYNRVGKGSPSEIILTRTKGGLSQVADQKDLFNTNSTTLKLNLYSWLDGGCPILHFSVEYKLLGHTSWTMLATDTTKDDLIVTDLDPATWYQLRISATNDAGTTTGSFNFATTTINGVRILPPSAFPMDLDSQESGTPITDPFMMVTVVCIIVLIVCSAIIGFVMFKRKGICHSNSQDGYEQSGIVEDKIIAERDNRRNQNHLQGAQPVYTANPGKQPDNAKVAEESEMYEISPYATFSVSGPGSRSVTASTLDYTVQFKTFGLLEDENTPEYPLKQGKWGRHRPHYTDDESTLSKSMTLAVGSNQPHSRTRSSQSGNQPSRSRQGHNSGNYKDSESDTSGSPCRESYRVPVKPPRGTTTKKIFRPDSSTESNNEASPLAVRRTPRHIQAMNTSSSSDSVLLPPSVFSDSRELSAAECDREEILLKESATRRQSAGKLSAELASLLTRYQERKEQERQEFTIHV